MVVRPEARRQGIGRLLVTALERTAAGRGFSQIWVATGNDAVDLYRACGWAVQESLTLASTGMTTSILTKQIDRRPITKPRPRLSRETGGRS